MRYRSLGAYVFFISSFAIYCVCFSQDQRLADSLVRVYNQGEYSDSVTFYLLKEISHAQTDPLMAEKYARMLIEKAEEASSKRALLSGYLQLGNALILKGDHNEALEAYFKSMSYAQDFDDVSFEGALYISIADVYSSTGSSADASLYYNKGIALLRQTSDSLSLAKALLNTGDEYLNLEKYDSALIYFRESSEIFEKKNFLLVKAYNLGNIGIAYASTGQNERAEININEAINILEDLEDYYPISVYLTYMANIYEQKDEKEQALNYAQRSLELSEKYNLKEQVRDASLTLSDLYKNFDQYDSAYVYYRKFIAYRDSLINIEQVKELANISTDFKVSLKQAEVDLLNQQKETQRIVIIAVAVTLFLIMLLAFGLYRRYKFIKATNRIIASEKEKSETLLLNILPAETAEELKNHGKVNAQQFNCSVLFTDFKEFTSYAEKADPQLLVESIDYYFREFDKVITKYGLEKIKTIGDAYMCAGGLPVSTQTHAKDVVLAAKEILEIVKREFHKDNDLLHFEVRMGIHTGTVIAGIVGLKKWQYDIWGDAVNIASRMESMSEPGKINLSESTYQKIKDEFPCTYRGEVEVKHRGALKMYFLD